MKKPKSPKCCRTKTQLISCHCHSKPRQVYFCEKCGQHYPIKNHDSRTNPHHL